MMVDDGGSLWNNGGIIVENDGIMVEMGWIMDLYLKEITSHLGIEY